jgi:hypothetical protein
MGLLSSGIKPKDGYEALIYLESLIKMMRFESVFGRTLPRERVFQGHFRTSEL